MEEGLSKNRPTSFMDGRYVFLFEKADSKGILPEFFKNADRRSSWFYLMTDFESLGAMIFGWLN